MTNRDDTPFRGAMRIPGALGGIGQPAPAPAKARAVLLDVPGQPIVLSLQGAAGERLDAPLQPGEALALAADLIASARSRIAGGGA
ncbi:hypothetical protein ACW7BJ_16320 [Azospirillum argentinense]